MASPQIPDYLIYGNDTVPTYTLLLEQYFQSKGKADQGRLFGLSFRGGASFNCWRGYKAVYKIEKDSLFLEHILSCEEKLNAFDEIASKQRIKSIFRDKMIDSRVFINWYSGKMKFPAGSKLLRWDGVFYCTYEQETVISVKNGRLVNTRIVNNYMDDPSCIDRRYKTSLTKILFAQLKDANWSNKNDFDCSETYKITIGKNGRIKKVDVDMSKKERKEMFPYREYRFCIKKMRKAFRGLKFDIVKDMGKAIAEDVYLEIWVEDDGSLENRSDYDDEEDEELDDSPDN